MKKLLLIPAIMLSTLAVASDYSYELTPVIGYNHAEGNLNLQNDMLVGLEAQFNDVDSMIKPELSILHSSNTKSENLTPGLNTDITRIAINGVYEYATSGSVIPFAKAGIGYESIENHFADNSSGGFITAGAGVKIPLAEAIALKLEAVYMLKEHKGFGDSNLATLAGLNFSFGKKAQPMPPVTDGDDDNDGVLNSVDKCPGTTPYVKVDANGCEVVSETDGDDDRDGVKNSMDKCPDSPAGAAVNAEGCPIVVNLHINFKTDSYEVDKASDANIEAFADFIKIYSPKYSAKIIGHTDNTGTTSYNQTLSENRANAVKDILVSKGVQANEVTTSGMGETAPISTNKTKIGRYENRRIEAEVIKN